MSSNQKRPLEETESRSCKKSKLTQPCVAHLRWKTWLLQNYEFRNGSLTSFAAIIEHSSSSYPEEKTNASEVKDKRKTFGNLIKQVWEGQVKAVRRTIKHCKYKRGIHYLNLARKAKPIADCASNNQPSSFDFRTLNLPANWSTVNDREGLWSFVRVQHFLVNNQRAVLEVALNMQAGIIENCTVRANGCAVQLNLEDIILARDMLSLNEQIELILKTMSNSEICQGYCLLPGEKIDALLPHLVQHVRDLTKLDDNEMTRVLSDNCTVLLNPTATKCENCILFKQVDTQKKRRKLGRQTIHPKCNKRWLDRSEIEEQLKKASKGKKLA